MPQYFKIDCVMEGGASHTYCVSRSNIIRAAADAVAFISGVVGYDPDGKPVTRSHWRDPTTGEYTNIVSAKPVREEPFEFDEMTMRHVNAIADAPKPEKD